MFEPKDTISQGPFGRIALSLSGGGYRAAAFPLGGMDMLERLDLLRDVSTLSTVSGGTFTGMRYALALKAGQRFRAFFDDFKRDLERVNVPKLAFEKLAKAAPLIPSGRWDIITACAQVYDEEFFGGQRFGVFWDHPPYPLTDLIFNSTEFRTAVAFRFRKSDNPKAKIGNGNVFITAEQAKQIRIADIVAASSCFPGGFEPLSFPNDFHWRDDDAGRAALEELSQNDWCPLPLMDGGVYDNQGIGSLLLRGSIPVEDFGLFIFSDTDQQQASLYRLPKPREAGWLRLSHLNLLWWVLLALAAISAFISWGLVAKPWYRWTDILNLLPLTMAAGTAMALIWIRIKIRSAFRAIPKLGLNAWDLVKRLKVNQFMDMVELRVSSLFALAASVFMRRIRRLVYDLVFEDTRIKKKLVPNLIYDLLQKKKYPTAFAWLEPSEPMCKVAAAAEAMPTTLWFTDSQQQMKDLIACGQMTMCYKLLLHIVSLGEEDMTVIPAHLQAVFEQARQFYLQLKADPYALIDAK
jgi:predicted acylesterase/phospholipase RssA